MPTLFLHTGLHKTGTTSLQHALFSNRDRLAANGFYYPSTGLSQKPGNWGHHELAYALRQRPTGEVLWQALRNEVEARALPNVIVSSEELSLLPFPGLPGAQPYRIIAERFAGWEIKLVCYLRPQAEMLASVYNHHVKTIGETRDILEVLAAMAPRLDYARYLDMAANVLKRDHIVVRRFDPTHLNGDTISDFAGVIGLPLEHDFKLPKKPLNPGLTDAGLAAMLDANRRFADDPAKLGRRRKRILRTAIAAPFEAANPLSDDARRVIAAVFRLKNRHIAHHYLGLPGDLFTTER